MIKYQIVSHCVGVIPWRNTNSLKLYFSLAANRIKNIESLPATQDVG